MEGWCVWEDGSFYLCDEDGELIHAGKSGDFAKPPEQKAPDSEGVETRRGDTVRFFDKVVGGPDGEPMTVAEVMCGTLVFEGGGAAPAYTVTHREPDSLEKLRDYVEECRQQECGSAHDVYREIADRLTALMERGA